MITVMGATGNTGRKIALGLLAVGVRVRAIGRDEGKLASLRDAGAETLCGDSSDAAFLAAAFRGASAVYTLLPTDQRAHDYRAAQDREGEAIARAVRESGVQRVVALSCVGTDVAARTGVIAGLRAQEQRLGAIGTADVLLLRPASFFENFFTAVETIREHGIVADTVEPDLAIPMVGTGDIADAAIAALLKLDWTGIVVRELLGPRDLSYREATRILGERIGWSGLAYVRVPDSEMIDALAGAGLSRSFAETYVEMTRAFNDGTVRTLSGRTPENTTPTTFETFADDLARLHAGHLVTSDRSTS